MSLMSGLFGDIKYLRRMSWAMVKSCATMEGWPDKPLHDQYRADLYKLAADVRCTGYYESALSRGMFAIFVKPTDAAL